MLGQVVVDDEHVLPLVHEVLPHGRPGIGGDVLLGGGVRRGGGDDDAVGQGAVLLQGAPELGHGGGLLADGHVDADHILVLLVQDGVHGDGGLASLAVADDQLPLAPADGDHGVDGQDARLEGPVHRLPGDHAGGLVLNGPGLGGLDGAQAVDGLAQGVHRAAQHGVPHGDAGGPAGALGLGTLVKPAGLPSKTMPTLSRSRFRTMPWAPVSNSMSSPYTARSRP